MNARMDKTSGYMYFIDRLHPCANSQGKVYLHRHVWWSHTGEIPTGYHVHHIDEDRANNNIDNLIKLSPEEHARLHHKRDKQKINCRICNRKFAPAKSTSTYCSVGCANMGTRKVRRPHIGKVTEMVHKYGYSKTGRLLGVSDNAIRKWFKRAGVLPLPSKQEKG